MRVIAATFKVGLRLTSTNILSDEVNTVETMIRNLIDKGFDFKNKIVPFKKSHLFHNLPGGSSGSSGSGDQLHVQEDTIFISGMDTSISEADIAQHFGSIGIIKVTPKLIY